MRKRRIRVLSTILSLTLVAAIAFPATVNAANIATEIVVAAEAVGERTNIKFLEGTPGDTHLIYTYQQNGVTYKAVENSTEDFRNVECQIFHLSEGLITGNG